MSEICHFCFENFNDSVPVILPCGSGSICRNHLFENKVIFCEKCQKDHDTEENFPMNKEFETAKKRKQLIDDVNRTQNLLAKIEVAKRDPYNYYYEYFGDLLNRIDLRKAELIQSIEDHFEEMTIEVKSVMAKYEQMTERDIKRDFSSFEKIDTSKINEDIERLTRKIESENNLKSLKSYQSEIKSHEVYLKNHLKDLLDGRWYDLSTKPYHLDYQRVFGKLTIETLDAIEYDQKRLRAKSLKKKTLINEILFNDYDELITISSDKYARVWNMKMKTPDCIKIFNIGILDPFICLLTEDGDKLVVYSNIISFKSYPIKVWNLKSGILALTIKNNLKPILEMRVLNGRLFTVGYDFNFNVWSLENGDLLIHSDYLFAARCYEYFSMQEKAFFISGCHDGSVKIFCLNTGECLKQFHGHTCSILRVVSISNNKILSIDEKNNARIWNSETSECLNQFIANKNMLVMNFPWYIYKEKIIFIGCHDGFIEQYYIETGDCLNKFLAHDDKILKFSPSGKDQLVSSSLDKKIKVWDLKTLKCLKVFDINTLAQLNTKLNTEECFKFETNEDAILISCGYGQNIRIFKP